MVYPHNLTQLTLGEIIDKLEVIVNRHSDEDNYLADFDFGSAVPTRLASWRGAYDELALGYRLSGYDATNGGHFSDSKASVILDELKSAVGKRFLGWKGGEYLMSRDSRLWVSNPGNGGNTGIVDVVDFGYKVVLMTAYFEY